MAFLEPLAAVAGGVVFLLVGGEVLVKYAVHLAVSYRVPKTVVGAIILGFGTSLPELLVSVTAAMDNSPGIAIGNVVGSNIANVGLILGLGAFMMTLHVQRRVIRADMPLGVLGALFLILWVGPRHEVSRMAGILLLVAFAAYLFMSMRDTRRHRAATELPLEDARKRPALDIVYSLVGLVLVGVGARVLVWGATETAVLLEVSERVIGLSMVAISTSLPELAACYAAARRGEADLIVGNIAGSNVFNVFFVLGTTAVIRPVPVEPVMEFRDFPMLAVFSVLAFPLMAAARRIRRSQGVVLLSLYVVYIAWTWGAG